MKLQENYYDPDEDVKPSSPGLVPTQINYKPEKNSTAIHPNICAIIRIVVAGAGRENEQPRGPYRIYSCPSQEETKAEKGKKGSDSSVSG
ncbi:hypothetical protein GJ744_005792 [Endocarpon pusillum]|uniref:Uncharacterized protein n=1 Tax=Endocarpon pusillum TaxID=364733 RepID=A0A8H7DWZ9_9EURO|nr:hypothetical protein GJ744_005792 [Endocarpon pusillum]